MESGGCFCISQDFSEDMCVIFWAGGGAISMCGRTVQVKRRFQ
jgi:hypothetical protein